MARSDRWHIQIRTVANNKHSKFSAGAILWLFALLLVIAPSSAFQELHRSPSSQSCMLPTRFSWLPRAAHLSHFASGSSIRFPAIFRRHFSRSSSAVMMAATNAVSANPTWASEMEDTSLERLQHRIQSFVDKYGEMCRLSLAMAGGGGHFLSTLASTPGSSRILLQGNILYDRESYRRFVKRTLPSESFRYASVESSDYAAHSALQQALTLAAAADPSYQHHPTSNLQHAVGVGAASALSSNDGTRKRSRAYCTVLTSDAFQFTLESRLAKAGDDSDRTRLEEDLFVAHCILTCLEYALQTVQSLPSLTTTTNGDDRVHIDETVVTTRGDDIRIQAHLNHQQCTTEDVLKRAAGLILDGQQESVLLLAKQQGTTTTNTTATQSEFQIVNQTVLPPLSMVFPGSFHPPHQGHVQLVKAALDATECELVWFELSLTNADKPPLQMDDVVERLAAFLTLRSDMPTHWGILLTNAPLFKQKVDLLHPLQVSRSYNAKGQEVLPPLHFVIGTDTLVRILNPKYYNHSHDDMLAVLRSMPCHYVVGGRVEQTKAAAPAAGPPPAYVSGKEEIDRLPGDLQSSFTLIDGFRVDISSSEIRRQQSLEEEEDKQANDSK